MGQFHVAENAWALGWSRAEVLVTWWDGALDPVAVILWARAADVRRR